MSAKKNQPDSILFLLPGKDKNNKYFELFEKSMSEFSHKVQFNNSYMDLLSLVRARGYVDYKNKTLVIFWSTILYGSAYSLRSLYLLVRNACLLLYLKEFYQFKISWIINNNYAHDYPHPVIDRLGRWMLSKFTSRFVVQQKSTEKVFVEKYPSKRIIFSPHPNYIDAYGPAILKDTDELRKSFGYQKDDLILASFGAIRPYKKLENIIRAFLEASKTHPRLKLLIAGKGNEQYVTHLQKISSGNQNIRILNQYIADVDIPNYLAIADYSIFYFDGSELTSGAVMLSLSYGVPVICRNIPAAEVVIATDTGFTFTTDVEFVRLLAGLCVFNRKSTQEIIDEVSSLTWSKNAQKMLFP